MANKKTNNKLPDNKMDTQAFKKALDALVKEKIYQKIIFMKQWNLL